MSGYIFNDIFVVDKLNPDGKKFDKVSRIEAYGEQSEKYMLLDVATDIYPMQVHENFTMVLASTLNLDGTADTDREHYTQAGTLADDFEYVMRGKLYEISEDASSPENVKVEIHASFGGLLMMLKGDRPKNDTFELDQRRSFLVLECYEHLTDSSLIFIPRVCP